ncbi:MAG: hypothetical protein R2682_01535 [Pyrinomonadaceae bacterium]
MRIKLHLTALCFWMIFAASPVFARSWKGITPLKTTRAEVIVLLGTPTGIDEQSRSVFSHADGTVRISWTRPDCVSKDRLWDAKDADYTALVYQITVEPRAIFKSIDEYEKLEPPRNDKVDSKAAYTRWVNRDVTCLVGVGKFGCSADDSTEGFGYSFASRITAIYYFAGKVETDRFLTKRPCSSLIEVQERPDFERVGLF